MTPNTDLLIVGGGLIGPTLALAASSAGLTSAVIDAKPEKVRKNKVFDGRSYALAAVSKTLFDTLGLWQNIAPHAQPILDIKVSDGRVGEGTSPFFMHFDHAEIEEGPMGYLVEDRHLRFALLDAVNADPNIAVLEDQVVDQRQGLAETRLDLASGAELAGTLLVGCDGRGSGTAARAGIKRSGRDYGQTSLVCAIAHEKPHHGIAHQFFMPAGPLAILPLTEQRSSIVWTETTAQAQAINALSDADYLTVLRPRFGDFLGDISLVGARYTYPLNLTLANALIADRVALAGDAAHGIHPIAGQGLNAGLRDVAALVDVVSDARRRGDDFGSQMVLARYSQWRRFDVATLAFATDSFNTLFSNDNPLLRKARTLGMGVVNALPGLRRGFMREAAGLTGDLPRLLRGEPLT